MTGKIVGSMRRTLNAKPAGRFGASLASSDSDWRAAVTMSDPQSKVTDTSALPRLVWDRMLRTPGTARRASSTGRVTCASI